MINKLDFDEWKAEEVTLAFYNAVREKWAAAIESLAYVEEDRLKYSQGYIQALVDISDIDFSEENA